MLESGQLCFYPHCATRLLTNYKIRLFIDPRGGLREDSLEPSINRARTDTGNIRNKLDANYRYS